MIEQNELNTFENYERALTKRLIEDTRGLNNKQRVKRKLENAQEVLKLNKLMSNKLYGFNDGLKLSTEYLNFLIRFYANKTKVQSKAYLKRFLKTLDTKFKSLKISKCDREYKKLIKFRYKDFIGIDSENEVLKHFEDTNPISYCLSQGFKQLHFIN